MRYLLDTNVVSALRVPRRNPAVEVWATSVRLDDLYLSAPTIAEIERGVIAKERTDPEQGSLLREWLEQRVLPAFAGRVASFDLAAARVLGSFRVPEHAPLDDALIAAIAVAHDMTLVSRNTKHFARLDGVRLLNPWDL